MFMLFGIILGLIGGLFYGGKVGKNRSDRVLYAASSMLAGFTIGAIITVVIELLV